MGQDIAKEPVDRTTDADFMDTGVLHQGRMCVTCLKRRAGKGSNECLKCSGEVGPA